MLDRQTLDNALSKRSTFGNAAEAVEPPDRTPVIPASVVRDNLRRVRTGAAFVTLNADGTRTYIHDPGVIRDGLISSVSVDRGTGSKNSITLLRDEATAPQEKPEQARDAAGKYTKAKS
jgi:hypothetical protein